MSRAPDVAAVDVRIVLVHSPVTGADVWGPVGERLRDEGCHVVLPRLADGVAGPLWAAHVDAVAEAVEVRAGQAPSPLVLVLHGAAGALGDQLVAALDAAGHAVEGVVYADADLPAGDQSRFAVLRGQDPGAATAIRASLDARGTHPVWSDAGLAGVVPDGARRRRLLDGARPRTAAWWDEVVPSAPTPPHVRAVLRFTDLADPALAVADARGWPVMDLRSRTHFLPLVDEGLVAEAILVLVEALLQSSQSPPPLR